MSGVRFILRRTIMTIVLVAVASPAFGRTLYCATSSERRGERTENRGLGNVSFGYSTFDTLCSDRIYNILALLGHDGYYGYNGDRKPIDYDSGNYFLSSLWGSKT